MEDGLTLGMALKCLGFGEWQHVVVRRKNFNNMTEYLGGGFPSDVIRRFGSCNVKRSVCQDNIIIIFVE